MPRSGPSSRSTLATAVCLAVGLALALAVLSWQVVAHAGLTTVDPDVATWMADNRVGWLTVAAEVVTWAGSSFVLIPLIVVVGLVVGFARREWTPLIRLGAALAGAIAVYNLVKVLVDRARPPQRLSEGYVPPGASFPSGHTAEAVAVWTMAALLAVAVVTRRRWLPVVAAALLVLAIAASRVYLDAHWLTDVLAGFAAGGLWISGLVAMILWRGRRPLVAWRNESDARTNPDGSRRAQHSGRITSLRTREASRTSKTRRS